MKRPYSAVITIYGAQVKAPITTIDRKTHAEIKEIIAGHYETQKKITNERRHWQQTLVVFQKTTTGKTIEVPLSQFR